MISNETFFRIVMPLIIASVCVGGFFTGWLARPAYDAHKRDQEILKSIVHMDQIPVPEKLPNPFEPQQQPPPVPPLPEQ